LKLEENLAQNIPSTKNGQYRQTEKVVKTLKIPAKLPESQDRWIAARSNDDNLEFTGVKFRHDQVPNVVGMGLRDAIYLLESKGLQVRIVGRGTVVKQSVNAGAKIQRGQEIVIHLG
jgi:cell division protein FtsI (penicillin-binding protein 3)